MPYEQPSDAISAGSLSAEAATELFRPIRKAVAGSPKDSDTSEEREDSTEEPEEREDSATDEPAEDEGEGETEHADDEESSEEPEEKADESDEEEPELHEVKVDGKVHKVTLDQLKKDYSFTAHNTRRAQELSDKELALSEQSSAVAENAKAYAEHLKEVKEALAAITPKKPDDKTWDKLRRENPAEFAAQWAAWDKHEKGLAKLDEERAKAIKTVKDEENKLLSAHLAHENELLHSKLPSWKDEKIRQKEVNGMKEFAKSQGFTEAELDNVVDHRTVLLLRAAYKHSIAQKARPENERKVAEVKALTPGSIASAPGRATVAAKALQKLDSSGTVEDAVAALQAQRAAGGRPRRR